VANAEVVETVQEWQAGGWTCEGSSRGLLRWFVSHQGVETCEECGHENMMTGTAVWAEASKGGRLLWRGWFCCCDCMYAREARELAWRG